MAVPEGGDAPFRCLTIRHLNLVKLLDPEPGFDRERHLDLCFLAVSASALAPLFLGEPQGPRAA